MLRYVFDKAFLYQINPSQLSAEATASASIENMGGLKQAATGHQGSLF